MPLAPPAYGMVAAHEPEAAYRAAPKPFNLRKALLKKHRNRCMSCNGVFEPQDLRVTRMGLFMEGEPEVNAALLCSTCYVRFHTDEVKWAYPVSTR